MGKNNVVVASAPAADLDSEIAAFVAGVTAPVAEEAPAPVAGRVTSRSNWGESQKVVLLVGSNPKRAGGIARARFDLYSTGMTVGAYLDACVRLETGMVALRKRHRYLADIAWDVKHGFIAVVDELPAAAEVPAETPAEETAPAE